MNLLDGYQIYKDIQGKEYDLVPQEKKEQLKNFRKALGNFTDEIFLKRGFISVPNGKGMWQNSGNFTKYMWNRYKLKDVEESNLVIYFNASTIEGEGMFISIGLIDDKLNEFEKKNSDEIYQFLEDECKKVNCPDFKRKNTGWGERVFSIVEERNFDKADYDCLLEKLKEIYNKTIEKFYISVKEYHNEVGVEKNKKDSNMHTKLNQILYGPPGTGKTYHTIDMALQIIDGKVPESREEAKDRFEVLKELGQIEFVTFHQSYGYEEFVEGIKADVESDDVRYIIEDGIFKRLSTEALFESILFDNFQEDLTYAELYDIVVQKYKREKVLKLKSKDKKIIEIRGISKKDNLYCYHEDSDVRHTVGKERLKKLYDVYNSLDKLDELSGFHDEFTKIIGGANQTVYWTILHEILKNKEEVKKENIVNDISYEKKKELVNESFNKKHKEIPKNYILIIDEINRGNISKIFGELITIIEESKRLGNEEAMEVTLPYSGEKFGVPNNLYIIGTMNTADRSIALMDTALRRRFEFVEMMPDVSLLKGIRIEGIDITKLLETINRRIEYLYDRDHTIGHAYFMSLKENSTLEALGNIFRNRVIPLLQEYFYDDWEKIRLVLGANQKEEAYQFITIKKDYDPRELFGNSENIEIDDETLVYEINTEALQNIESYLKVYEK